MSAFRPSHPGFLVWNPDGRYPRVVHSALEDATREAQRLARDNPGLGFYVMGPIGMAHVPAAQAAFHPMSPLAISSEDAAAILNREIPF